jgi:diguanylate cyclase (GGDEF)-like protein
VPPPHFVARYGGEEFCAFLGEVEASEGLRIAEGLRASLAAQPIDIRGQALKLTVSIGVAALADGDLDAAIRSADQALYQAKDQGRDQVILSQRKVTDPSGVMTPSPAQPGSRGHNSNSSPPLGGEAR